MVDGEKVKKKLLPIEEFPTEIVCSNCGTEWGNCSCATIGLLNVFVVFIVGIAGIGFLFIKWLNQ